MKRSMRLAAIAVGVLGLVATSAPQPAKALTVGTAAFLADITVGTGLGYPILTLTIQTNVLTAPGATPLQTLGHLVGGSHPPTNCLPLPNDFLEDPACLTNSHWTFPNLRPLTVSHIVCVDVLANIAKPKDPVHLPPGCEFTTVATPTLANTVSGHCGLSSGQLTVLFTDNLGNDYLLDIHFKGLVSVIVITGHWRKLGSNQHGLLIALAQALPPTNTAPPPVGTTSQGCAKKTARDFLVAGVAKFIPDPRLA